MSMPFTQEQVRKFFSRIVKDDAVNKEGLVNYLADQIMDRYNAIDELMMIALDMTPELKYEVGDTVYVNINSTYIGSYDLDLMVKHDLVLKEDHTYVKGTIIAVRAYRSNPYSVKIRTYNTSGAEDFVTRDIADHGIYHEKIIPAPGRLNVGDII